MMIDYRCNQCGKLLRAPDDAAGKQARCPACGSIQAIPAPAALPIAPAAAGSPFREQSPGAVAVNPANPYAATYYDAGVTAATAARPIHPTRIDIGDVLSRTWVIYKPQALQLVGVVLAVSALGYGVGFGLQGAVAAMRLAGVNELATMFLDVGVQFASQIFSLWIGLGFVLLTLNMARGANWSFGDLFRGGPYLIYMVAAMLIWFVPLMLLVGLCIVPGAMLMSMLGSSSIAAVLTLVIGSLIGIIILVYAGITIVPLSYVLVDQSAGPIEALMICRQITSGNRLTLILLGIVCAGIVLLGLLAFCVGVLFAAAFTYLLYAVVYLAMSGQPAAVGPAREQ